jgi:hypothetical protein
MSRPRTSGRFKTRAELVDRVRFLYFETALSIGSIAGNCGVALMTVDSVIKTREWETLSGDDYISALSDAFDVDVHIDSRSLSACGAGYDFPLYPLHIPDRIKHDLDLI